MLRRALEMSGQADSIDLGSLGHRTELLCGTIRRHSECPLPPHRQRQPAVTPARTTGGCSQRNGSIHNLLCARRFRTDRNRRPSLRGGDITLDASVSSQFVSALMLASPLMESPLRIATRPTQLLSPYLKMTAAMMTAAGVLPKSTPMVSVSSAAIGLSMPMWSATGSAAAFWYEIAALTAGWVTLPGLREKSARRQSGRLAVRAPGVIRTEFTAEGAGLSATPDLFSRLEADMSDTPDMVPALAVTAALAGIPFELSGVANLRHKGMRPACSLARRTRKK